MTLTELRYIVTLAQEQHFTAPPSVATSANRPSRSA